jgi:NTE family protein
MASYQTLQDVYSDQPFTLALSSGFFGFFAHLGFVQALEEKKLSPRAYTGASAGAIVAAAMASGWSSRDLEEMLVGVKFSHFFDPRPGFGLVRGLNLRELLSRHMKADFSALEKPLAVSAFNIKTRKTKVLDGGDLPRAVWASCAIPVLFHPVRVGTELYWDGGIFDKVAVAGVADDEPLLSHFLPSGVYERPALPVKWGTHRRQVRLTDIPRCGPHKMHLGREIIAFTRKQTRAALEAKLD